MRRPWLMRTALVAAAVAALSAYPLYRIHGKLERSGMLHLKPADFRARDATSAAEAVREINSGTFIETVTREAARIDPGCGFSPREVEINVTADGTVVMVHCSFSPWRRSRYSLETWSTISDLKDPVAQTRNTALGSAYRSALNRISHKHGPAAMKKTCGGGSCAPGAACRSKPVEARCRGCPAGKAPAASGVERQPRR